jgi:hypothetical protein
MAWSVSGPGDAETKGPFDRLLAEGDERLVPAGSVLVLEKYKVAVVVDPASKTSGVDGKQSDQSVHLGFGGEQLGEQGGQASGLVAEDGPDEICA